MSTRTFLVPMGGGGPDPSNFYTKAEIDVMLAPLVDKTVDDLENYYLKTETYTQAEVQSLVGAIEHFVVVSVLPTEDIKTNVIYLLGPIGTGSDQYEEYIWANSAWVKIGDTSIDLTNYVTISMLNTALADYTTTAELDTLLDGKQDVLTAGDNITIEDNVISATDTTYTAGEGIDITNNVISATGGGGNQWFGTKAEFDNLEEYDENVDYFVQDGVDWADINDTPFIATKVSELTNDSSYTTKNEVNSICDIICSSAVEQAKIDIEEMDWYGTKAEFDAIVDKDPSVRYHIEGEEPSTITMTFTFDDDTTMDYDLYYKDNN